MEPDSRTDREILIEILGHLREFAELRRELEPLLKLARSTNGGTIGLMRARKAARGV